MGKEVTALQVGREGLGGIDCRSLTYAPSYGAVYDGGVHSDHHSDRDGMSIVVIMTFGRTFGTVVAVMVMVVSFPTRFIINWDIRFPVDAAIVWIGSDITSTKYAYSS